MKKKYLVGHDFMEEVVNCKKVGEYQVVYTRDGKSWLDSGPEKHHQMATSKKESLEIMERLSKLVEEKSKNVRTIFEVTKNAEMMHSQNLEKFKELLNRRYRESPELPRSLKNNIYLYLYRYKHKKASAAIMGLGCLTAIAAITASIKAHKAGLMRR